jgi:hypothetical protein
MSSKQKLSRWGWLVMLVPAGALLAAEGGRVEKTFKTTENPRISLSNLKGTIVVRGWDKSEVHAVCLTTSPRVEIDCDQMPAAGEAEKVHFATHLLGEGTGDQNQSADYTLEVPVGSSLDIHDPDGAITVQRVSGDQWIESVKASVSVSDGAGHVSVRSLNGDIDLIRPTGRIEASSVMGTLRFKGSTSPMVRAHTTGSGRIIFEGSFVPSGDYVLSSYQGDVEISCPASDSFELRARTVHGKVNNELQLNRKNHVPFSYGSGLFGVHNQGDATVELSSYNGTIHLRPRP